LALAARQIILISTRLRKSLDYGIPLIQINGNGYHSIKVVDASQETGQQCIQEWQRP
jgi:hypothetical protein